MKKDIAILVPCYNEELTIEKVIDDFQKNIPEAKIYVYDNNSSDRTFEIAKAKGVEVRKEPRQGKGNVVRSMFRDIDADYYVMIDGDDTYPAEAVHDILKPLVEGTADMTIGDRLSNGTYAQENKRAFHGLGNWLVRKLVNILFNNNIQDIMTGYRGFTKEFVKTMPVLSEKFEIETEMSIHSMDKRLRVLEVPIDYRDRPEGSESKLNTISDGYKVLKMLFLLVKDYKPRFFFSVLGLVTFIIGILIGAIPVFEFLETSYVSKLPTAILAVGVILVSFLFFTIALILDTMVKHEKMSFELYRNQYRQGERNENR